jgi:peptide/nickel transport system permease protein
MTRVFGFLGAFRRSAKLSLGMAILLLVVLVGVLNGPLTAMISRHVGGDPLDFNPDHWQKPGSLHPLGTDSYGRDVLALVLTGLVTSLKIGVIAGVISTLIAVVIAFVAAYKGGLFDAVLATFTDFFLVIPTLPLLIAWSAFDKNVNLFQIAVILAVFSWPGAARHIRSQVLSLRSRPYIDLAKVTRLNDLEIIFEELVPNMLPFIALGMAYAVVGAMTALVGLEIIGLGPSGVTDLGLVLNLSQAGALTIGAWGIFVAPIFILVLIFFGLTLINIGLEEVYNPRLRKVAGA